MSDSKHHTPSLKQRAIYRFCWLLCIPLFGPVFRPKVFGRKNIPKEGPVLLLGNHTAMLDPVLMGWFCGRPVHFMASEQLFRINPFLGWLLPNLNAFPKAKGVKDRSSMLQLVRRYKSGGIVNLFPEGERTWTGRLLPIVPSTPRMLKRLNARVVYARTVNGHLSHPRWAHYPRWIRLRVEYSEVFHYDDPDRSEEDIMAEMIEQMQVIPEEVEVEGLSFGWRMAYGLPSFLWACPSCFAQDALRVAPDSGNAVVCGKCSARWRIDVSQRLHAESDNAEDTRVVTAYDKVLAHYGSPPISDRTRTDGVLLETAGASVWQIHRGVEEPEVIGTGTLRLTAERVALHGDDGAVIWEKAHTDIKAVLASVGDRLQLRTKEDNFQLNPANESRNKWQYFIKAWWTLAKEQK